jgi:hypothetical protein
MCICSISIVAALGAALQSAPLEAALASIPDHSRAQRFRYSVVSARGRAMTVTIAPNAVEALVPGKAPELRSVRGPWGISHDFD